MGPNYSLYVGGTRIKGKTVVERWTFDIPSQLPSQAEAFDRVSVDALYNLKQGGRHHVVHLIPLLDTPGVMVLHHDSRDIWTYFENSGTWELMASAGPSAQLEVEELDDSLWSTVSVYSHKTQGAMYVFNLDLDEYTLVLFDSNFNGYLDSHAYLSLQQWTAGGYASAANYNPVQ